MAKVLLVEDDNNLREIFEMRLQAEGYQTLTAGDGEEALVIAMKDKPDLIIADVMMPKMSGFEMLETLRKTPEVANIKVIMMTALGQAEDQVRGAKLGVIKYLVKSQVTLEDFARVVREVLAPGSPAANAPAASGTSSSTEVSSNNNQVESEKSMDPTTPTNPDPSASPSVNPISDSAPADASGQQSEAQEASTVQSQINNFAAASPSMPPAGDAPAPASDSPAMPPMGGDSSTEHADVPVETPSDPAAGPSDPASTPPTEAPA
jgi:CheY-like chemotaxis protein